MLRIEIKNEFPFILSLSVILVVLIGMDGSGTGRVVLGLPFVLFFPGYTLIAALFPARGDLDGIERLALSFGLSIAVVPLLGVILNCVPWGIGLYPILVTLLVFTILLSAIAICRRKKLSLENRFGLSLNVKPIKWGSLSRLDKILAAVLAAVIILAIGSLYYTAAIPAAGEKFTEFYLLGSDGKAEGYPRVMKTGETKEVILGTVNHEGRQVSYTVQVRMDGEVKRQLGPFQADNEEKKEESVSFRINEPHENLKVEFLLFKDGESVPYRSLHLWVNVQE
ncbi:protein of unknown function DUF1616 [Syntrophobotulus glycolicus DSM 8271]|uniref:DUF1616 domain-containing protein n=1 Tax=Syntrophobotulus glycolicus (strain DSM 8271 / FlGlyR) TaxID=645991 RepID=F0T1T6_SYNGF|nr:DUF1616 domain-containing protein [Syntrophobotulus glycolicus]ADY55200.1 protein of unknown function DUF1616 [Syntrophobotulus glycolicus DSM 8271]